MINSEKEERICQEPDGDAVENHGSQEPSPLGTIAMMDVAVWKDYVSKSIPWSIK